MPSNIWWLEQTEAPLDDDWLGAREAARLEELKFPKRRSDWRLGRWTAKQAIASFLQLPRSHSDLRHIEIRPAPSGAPEAFLDGEPAHVSISLSHSGGAAMCALAQGDAELGCDLEATGPHDAALVGDYFTSEEQQLVAVRPNAELHDFAVVLIWSAKESAMKALREGLRIPTHDVCVSFGDLGVSEDEWHPLRVTHRNGRMFQGWWHYSSQRLRTVVCGGNCNPPILLLAS